MKVSMIILAIALTACGTKNSQSNAAAVEDVEILNERVAKLEAELDAKNNEVQIPDVPDVPEIKTEEVKKPAISQEEIWAIEDIAATRYSNVGGVITYTVQHTYKNEDGNVIRTNYSKYENLSYPPNSYTWITESQWSYKHSIWLIIRTNGDTSTFENAEKEYEAFKAKQGA